MQSAATYYSLARSGRRPSRRNIINPLSCTLAGTLAEFAASRVLKGSVSLIEYKLDMICLGSKLVQTRSLFSSCSRYV